MLTRRRFVGYSALSSSMLAYPPLLRSAFGQTSSQRPLRLAILGSTYRCGSNLQTIADRFLVGYPYEGDWHMPNVQVVSVYVDERIRRATAAPNEFQLAITGRARRSQPPKQIPPNGGKPAPDERWEPMAPPSEEQGLTSDLSPARAAVRVPPLSQYPRSPALWRRPHRRRRHPYRNRAVRRLSLPEQ